MANEEESISCALNLDEGEQNAFIRYYKDMPEKSAGTMRLFNRSDYYCAHGDDVFLVENICKNVTVKFMGREPKLSYVCINKNNFDKIVKELLLVMQYRVEVFVRPAATKNNDWKLEYKGSPGNLEQFEDILFANADLVINAIVMSVKIANGNLLGIACANSSECTFSAAEFTDNEFYTELEALLAQTTPKECIIPAGETADLINLKDMLERNNVLVVQSKKTDFSSEDVSHDLNRLLHFAANQQRNSLSIPETSLKEAMGALQATIKYLNLTSNEKNFNQFKLSGMDMKRYVRLDYAALNALNVINQTGVESAKNQTLFDVLDSCATRQGKRLLDRWLKQPLQDFNILKERLDTVEALIDNAEIQGDLGILNNFPDLILLAKKLCSKNATLKDCYSIYQTINYIPSLLSILKRVDNASINALLIEPLNELWSDLEKYQSMIEQTIDMDLVENDQYLIKPTFDESLNDLCKQRKVVEEKMQSVYQNACKELDVDTKTLKLEPNDQFGFVFRVTTKEEKLLRKNKKFLILNAIKGGVRFTNSKLQDLSDKYSEIKKIYENQQQTVVKEILDVAAGYADSLRNLNMTIAIVDVLTGFAKSAANAPTPYVRPKILPSGSGKLNMRKARHPCLERQDDIDFIPNDVRFKQGDTTFHIITGPNMAGKSTFMRTIGINVLMAHIGSFVAADFAEISIVDSIFARIGADDSEQKGLSTFMMEMVETCSIIRSATANSLVIIDELGRGTSTYDGCGISCSIAEHLAKEIKAFTLFATHFQEITMLEEQIGTVNNLHVTAIITEKVITPLYLVKDGICDKSYGIQCARAAEFPEDVINFAVEYQKKLEDAEGLKYIKEFEYSVKRKLIEDGSKVISNILDGCKNLDVEGMSDEDLYATIKKIKIDLGAENNLYIKSLIDE